MSKAHHEHQLEALIEHAAELFRSPESGPIPGYKFLTSKDPKVDELKQAIRQDESLGYLRQGWLTFDNGGSLVADGSLSAALARLVADGKSAMEALAEYRAIAASCEASTDTYILLTGVTLEGRISLTPDMELMAWSEVPDGPTKEKFSDTPERYGLSVVMPWIAHPTAAIKIASPKRIVLFESSEAANTDMARIVETSTKRSELVQQVVGCLSLLAKGPVEAVGSWSEFTNPYIQAIAPLGYGWTSALSDFSLIGASRKPVAIEPREAQTIYARYAAHSREERELLAIVVSRLNISTRRPTNVDKAIDLGIALEALLGDEQSQTELSYRLSLRGAAFLGGTAEEKKASFQLFKDAYDLRSKAVHHGKLKDNDKAARVISETTERTFDLVRQVVELPALPDWEALILR